MPRDYKYDYIWSSFEWRNFRKGRGYSKPSEHKTKNLVNWLRNVSYHYETEELAYSLGMDYAFQDAEFSFAEYDEYLKYVKKNTENWKTTMDYVLADEFLKILHKKSDSFEPYKKDDDFFPYRDDIGAYWTGYFTTHPYLKKLAMDNGRLL